MKKLVVLLGVSGLLTVGASADLLTAFDFGAYAGSEAQGTSTVAAVGIEDPTYISRGAGLTASANAGRFNAQGWGETSAANAIANNDYFEFIVTPELGYSMTVTQISFQVQRSNTGASNLVLRTSADGFASDLNTMNNFAGNNATVTSTYDSSGDTELQNVTGALTFRVYGWTGASGGSLGFEGTGNDIQIFGTAVVPEPASAALIMAGLGLIGFMRRRMVR